MLRFTPEPADAGALCYKQKMRNDLSIREEKSKDFPFIRSLTEQAFLNVPESDHTEHLLVERLRHQKPIFRNCLWWQKQTQEKS